jgi:hypothetical protein
MCAHLHHGRAAETSVYLLGGGAHRLRQNAVHFPTDTSCESSDRSPSQKIVYCNGEFQPLFSEFPDVEFQEGLPDVGRFDGRYRCLLILDDLMNEANQNVCDMFTKLSHHRDVSVVFVTQNLFHRNRFVRMMNLNTHYLVLFKNPRDANQVSVLARQMYPGRSKFVVEAYKDATKNPYGYLLIDLRPETDESYRIRTNIFPDDDRQYAYVPKV